MARFVKMKNDKGNPVWINPNHVIAMREWRDTDASGSEFHDAGTASVLIFTDGSCPTVLHPPEEAARILSGAMPNGIEAG